MPPRAPRADGVPPRAPRVPCVTSPSACPLTTPLAPAPSRRRCRCRAAPPHVPPSPRAASSRLRPFCGRFEAESGWSPSVCTRRGRWRRRCGGRRAKVSGAGPGRRLFALAATGGPGRGAAGGGVLGQAGVKALRPSKETKCRESGVTPLVPGARPCGASGARGVPRTGREMQQRLQGGHGACTSAITYCCLS